MPGEGAPAQRCGAAAGEADDKALCYSQDRRRRRVSTTARTVCRQINTFAARVSHNTNRPTRARPRKVAKFACKTPRCLFVSLLASSLYSLFLRCRGDGVLPESFLPLQWRRQLSVVASTRAVRQQTRPFFSTNRSVRVMRFPLTD